MTEERQMEGRDTVGPVHPAVRRRGLRRLYDWVLSWAERPGGPWALGGLAFAESSFFPVPPDPLLIALSLGAPRRAFAFALICAVGSITGGIVGYGIGWALWSVVGHFFFTYVPGVTPAAFETVRALYDRYDFWAVFTAGLTPIPYKVFTLSAGVFAISFPVFVLASALSRSARFFAIAALIFVFGARIQDFIDRYFDWLAWAFFILLVGGFLIIKFVV
ncbi:MAG: DedA family protein [Gemmatimonadota bacterium]